MPDFFIDLIVPKTKKFNKSKKFLGGLSVDGRPDFGELSRAAGHPIGPPPNYGMPIAECGLKKKTQKIRNPSSTTLRAGLS
jgi:hypothetical protein